jgi:Polyketide cyclase / dehydrase and lipid transport
MHTVMKPGWKPLAIACSFAVLPSLALAHGPSRQKIVETVDINAPCAKVWAKIGNFQDMSWLPPVAKTEGQGGNEKGATRTLTLKNGGVIEEALEKHDDQSMSYFYRITNVDVKVLPVTNYSSWLSLKPEGDAKCTVEWKGAFYRGYPNNDPPPELNDETAVKAVSGVYRTGLDALKKSIEESAS